MHQRNYFANKGPSSQGYGFSCGHVRMWELDCEEGWALENWCFWNMVLEKTLESPWTARTSKQSILKEMSPGISLEGMMLKLKLQLFATPWAAARQTSLSNTNSQSLPKLMSIESVMPSSHLILCRPFLFLPPIPPSIRVFSNESTLCIRWPKYWSFSFSISPSNEHPGLISFTMDWLYLLAV